MPRVAFVFALALALALPAGAAAQVPIVVSPDHGTQRDSVLGGYTVLLAAELERMPGILLVRRDSLPQQLASARARGLRGTIPSVSYFVNVRRERDGYLVRLIDVETGNATDRSFAAADRPREVAEWVAATLTRLVATPGRR